MKKMWAFALGLPAVGVAVGVMSKGHAADRRSAAESGAEIVDVYAFVSPATPSHMVLIMDLRADGENAGRFDDKAEYGFRVHPVTNPASLATGTEVGFTCSADGAAVQSITCASVSGMKKTVRVGDVQACAPSDDMCLFAGLRSDPFFFDAATFETLVRTRDAASVRPTKNSLDCDGGTNFFASSNVVSLVIEVSSAKAFNQGDASGGALPLLTIAAEKRIFTEKP